MGEATKKNVKAGEGEEPVLLAFFNSKSGGQMGDTVGRSLCKMISPDRVFDLKEVGEKKWTPEDKLREYVNHASSDVRVLACGGDGTMGWLFSCIDRVHAPPGRFPLAMMPLGTGNDLSRSFGWGPGFSGDMLKPAYLDKVRSAQPIELDRWLLCVMPYEPLLDAEKIKATHLPPTLTIHQYPPSNSDESGDVKHVGRTYSRRMSREAGAIAQTDAALEGLLRAAGQSPAQTAGNKEATQAAETIAKTDTAAAPQHENGAKRGEVDDDAKADAAAAPAAAEAATVAAALEEENIEYAPGEEKAAAAQQPSSTQRTSDERNEQLQEPPPPPPPPLPLPASSADGEEKKGAESEEEAVVVVVAPPAAVSAEGKEAAGAAVNGKEMAGSAKEKDKDANGGAEAAEAEAAEAAAANDDDESGERNLPAAAGNGNGSGNGEGGSSVTEKVELSRAPTVAAKATFPTTLPATTAAEEEGKEPQDAASSNGVVIATAEPSDTPKAPELKADLGAESGREEVGEKTAEKSAAASKKEGSIDVSTSSWRRHPEPSIQVIEKFPIWESYDGVFCNYFSVGVDAVAAAAFHEHRNAHPELFTSRTRNQLWYIQKGFPAAGGLYCCSAAPPRHLYRYMSLSCRGINGNDSSDDWVDVPLPKKARGLIVLNLQSYGGGRDLWGVSGPGTACKAAKGAHTPTFNDGLLEIVAVTNIYSMGGVMALNKVGATAIRVCQCKELRLRIRDEIHMQVDGEPWKQAAAMVHIKHVARSTCLVPNKGAARS